MLPAKFARGIELYNGALLMWNKTLVRQLEVCRRTIKNHKKYSVEFLVFTDEDHCQPLLGLCASEQMNLVKIKKNFHCVAAVVLDAEFEEVCDDKLGKLPGMITLKVKSGAIPVVMAN